MTEPVIKVGIMQATTLQFNLSGSFRVDDTIVEGPQTACLKDGKIEWKNQSYNELIFLPTDKESCDFELTDVVIGVDFHWERKEVQRFRGALRLIIDGDKMIAINEIGVEDYLTCVISSEMNATASLELLKAHAVISRSWLLSQIEKREKEKKHTTPEFTETSDTRIKWYDREDHNLFDVCADDHCQRYQGITRASTPKVIEAIAATRGELLYSCNEICDARYSKCCGGAMEIFSTCWEEKDYPYLLAKRDAAVNDLPDLTKEAEAVQWIKTAPDAFCNTADELVLKQVLNYYDQETPDFYRWKVEYSQQELQQLLSDRGGIDIGEITSITAIERGPSARIKTLKISGTKGSFTLGKELEIRRSLSASHLFSSAFVVDAADKDRNGIPQRFIITGAGWGHGVGLCQIGAAMMGEKGYDYKAILQHYYPTSELKQAYL